jgi:hypothetical protein
MEGYNMSIMDKKPNFIVSTRKIFFKETA